MLSVSLNKTFLSLSVVLLLLYSFVFFSGTVEVYIIKSSQAH